MESSKKYVAYYRVSTKRQGRSRLGLEAQKETIKNCTQDGRLVAEFVEMESGKNNNRVELDKAIELSNSQGAELVIAKLDRLSRNVSFIFQLKESGVRFKACDLPDFNTLTLGVFASFAQYEREQISARTKAALAKKLERDGWWGVSNLTDEHRRKGREIHVMKSFLNKNKRLAMGYAKELRDKGMTYDEIAAELNRAGYKTSRGKEWSRGQVYRLLR